MANLFKVFKDLIPDHPLLVGTVVSVETGKCVIQLPGGAYVTGRGDAVVWQKVFIRDGVIEGHAPDLTVQLIEV